MSSLSHLKNAWQDGDAPADPVDQLIYRSNLLGSDPRITNTGGGNTSAKICTIDPDSGTPSDVMWVRGSGGDLRTATRANFAALNHAKLLAMRAPYLATPDRGEKSEAENRQVALYRECAWAGNSVPCSIDTPLHAFIPARHVDHTHPHAVIAIAASRLSRELTRQVYGDDVGWVRWMCPGFELGLTIEATLQQNPRCQGLILAQHGLINWADTGKACYERTLSLIERAARFIEAHDRGEATFVGVRHRTLSEETRNGLLHDLLPWLGERVSERTPMFGHADTDAAVLQFVCSKDAPRLAELGTSCPDHFLRTKIKPLLVPWDSDTGNLTDLKATLEQGFAQYRHDYAAYYQSHARPDSPPMRDSNPTVILIPGVGMITFGKSERESQITAEFYRAAIEVMRGAEAIDEYIALPPREAFDIEYWSLEEAKLQRMKQ